LSVADIFKRIRIRRIGGVRYRPQRQIGGHDHIVAFTENIGSGAKDLRPKRPDLLGRQTLRFGQRLPLNLNNQPKTPTVFRRRFYIQEKPRIFGAFLFITFVIACFA